VEPIHEHDCDRCRFLGTDVVRDENERRGNGVDMYVCADALGGPTVIRRYGPEEHYSSWPLSMVTDDRYHMTRDERWRVVVDALNQLSR
jgi:hypothetical protein